MLFISTVMVFCLLADQCCQHIFPGLCILVCYYGQLKANGVCSVEVVEAELQIVFHKTYKLWIPWTPLHNTHSSIYILLCLVLYVVIYLCKLTPVKDATASIINFICIMAHICVRHDHSYSCISKFYDNDIWGFFPQQFWDFKFLTMDWRRIC